MLPTHARLAGTLWLLLAAVLAACGKTGTNISPPPGGGGVNPVPAQRTDVVTYKNDAARTGQNLTESVLTLTNVNPASFGRLRFLATDGKVDAEPLYLSGLTVQGAMHDVVFVATENDSVYAFDAESGALLWQVSVLAGGETASGLPPSGCGQVTPTIGITATPVIDRTAGANGFIYLVAMSKTTASSTYHQRLHALDVTTGAEALNGPVDISATYPMLGGTTTFDPAQYEERAALLLARGLDHRIQPEHARPHRGVQCCAQQRRSRSCNLDERRRTRRRFHRQRLSADR